MQPCESIPVGSQGIEDEFYDLARVYRWVRNLFYLSIGGVSKYSGYKHGFIIFDRKLSFEGTRTQALATSCGTLFDSLPQSFWDVDAIEGWMESGTAKGWRLCPALAGHFKDESDKWFQQTTRGDTW